MEEVGGRRYDLAKGRGGLDLYKKDWMTNPHVVSSDGNGGRPLDRGMGRVAGLGSLGAFGDTSSDPNAQVDEAGMVDFQAKWTAVKAIFTDFEQQVGQKIIDKLNKIEAMQTLLVAQGDTNLAANLNTDLAEIRADLDTYWVCKGYKDDYYDMWVSVASSVGLAGVRGVRGVRGLGFLPLVGAALYLSWGALAAITYIALHGLDLYIKYKQQTYVLDQLATPNLSPEARASLDAVAKQTPDQGILQTVESSVVTGVQIAVLIAVAFLGYKAYQST
jgi:hypothetical protein